MPRRVRCLDGQGSGRWAPGRARGLPEVDAEPPCRDSMQMTAVVVHHVGPAAEGGNGDLCAVWRPCRHSRLRADRPAARHAANRRCVSAARGDQLQAAAAGVVRDPRAVRRPGRCPRVTDEEPRPESVEADDRDGVRSVWLDALVRDRAAIRRPCRRSGISGRTRPKPDAVLAVGVDQVDRTAGAESDPWSRPATSRGRTSCTRADCTSSVAGLRPSLG